MCVCEVMCVCQVVLSLCVCEVMCVCYVCYVKFVCVKLLSVKFVYVKFVCSVCVEEGGRRRRRRSPGYRIKNKNPTQRCGELGDSQKPCFLILLLSFQYRLTTNWFHSIVSWRVKI